MQTVKHEDTTEVLAAIGTEHTGRQEIITGCIKLVTSVHKVKF